MKHRNPTFVPTTLAGLLALSLGAACSQTPEPLDDCSSGTCDTPDMSARNICETVCDGRDNEVEVLGEAGQDLDDRLQGYQDMESSAVVDKAVALLKPIEEGWEAEDYASLSHGELAQFVCTSECREEQAVGFCESRRHDAIEVTQPAFKRDYFRWAAADVDGVTLTSQLDSRGQEYTEYFALVQLPGSERHEDLGRNLVDSRGRIVGQTPQSLNWSEDQDFELEDAAIDGDKTVGQCIFTSWHSDVDQPLPICGEGECPNLSYPDEQADKLATWVSKDTGVPVNKEMMQMKVSFNSNLAASDLVEQCLREPLTAEYNEDLYVRGCMGAYQLFETEWRRSDSEVCVVATRLAECGCKVEVLDEQGEVAATITDPAELGKAVVPMQIHMDEESGEWVLNDEVSFRGFQLGTWSAIDELPEGCRVVETGDTFPSGKAQRNIVACDISASALRSISTPQDDGTFMAADVKELCRTRYGNDVVVHVPIPAPESTSEYLPIPTARVTCDESCGADPWVITEETE